MTEDRPPEIPLKEIIEKSAPQLRELRAIYDLLPLTTCQRQGRCCSLLPEMTFLEALAAFKVMMSWSPVDRIKVLRKMAQYFFCNAAEIQACPFLSGKDCLIYEDRFFGCRAYGLWSRNYYQDLADQNREGKRLLQQQWASLGIALPGEVLSFEVPYCSHVEIDQRSRITDEILTEAAERMENLSGELSPWDHDFKEKYFSDLGFFLTGLQFGTQEAVRLKFFITRDLIQKRDSTRLEEALRRVA